MSTLEVIFGNSLFYSIKNSSLAKNELLLFNAFLNVGNLNNIDNYIIDIPNDLCNELSNYNFLKEVLIIKEAINKNKKIRIWTSHYNVYSYLIMLYVCSIADPYKCQIYVTYSDEYNMEYITPSIMRTEELEKLAQLEHELSKVEISAFSKKWNEIKKDNSDMRVLENGQIMSVSIDYYDKMILDSLKELGEVKILKLLGNLMGKVYLIDSLYIYLIRRLIDDNKIKIKEKNNLNFLDSIVVYNNIE